MAKLPRTAHPPIDFAAAALVLGTIGLHLFLLPVLGVPLSGLALLLAMAGLGRWLADGAEHIRWVAAGITVATLALVVNLAIAFSPAGYIPNRPAIPPWRTVPDHPYVSPPARPGALTHMSPFSIV
jgi:hypothetical protein